MSDQPDQKLQAELDRIIPGSLVDNKLPCALAFQIAEQHQIKAEHIGQYVDQKGIKLSKCQLGLFGYAPSKKIVEPQAPDSPEMRRILTERLKDNEISCLDLWDIAFRYGVPKIKIANICEYLEIKIRHCQLGAF